MEIEINALRAGGKTIVTSPNDTTKVTAKARILKGTALAGTTLATTLTIEASTGGDVIGMATTAENAITLGVGKGGKGASLVVDTEDCSGGLITFSATFTGLDKDLDICTKTRVLHKACR
jgi:lipoprotein-anchoring transpeptidase ErfK/SrfK